MSTTTERVTITLPTELVREIDRLQKNRSKFVLEAVRRELQLRRSLRAPHSEAQDLAEAGFDDWVRSLPAEDSSDLVDTASGTPVRWVPGEGWLAEGE